MPSPAEFSGDMKMYRPGSFEPVPVLSAHGFDHDSRGVGTAEMAWSLRLGLHCQEIIQGIGESARTGRYYHMTTTCERPKPLPKGCRGLAGFSVEDIIGIVVTGKQIGPQPVSQKGDTAEIVDDIFHHISALPDTVVHRIPIGNRAVPFRYMDLLDVKSDSGQLVRNCLHGLFQIAGILRPPPFNGPSRAARVIRIGINAQEVGIHDLLLPMGEEFRKNGFVKGHMDAPSADPDIG